MKKKGIAALCASALVIGGAEAAVAHNTSTPTTVELYGTAHAPEGTYRAFGDLHTSRKCRADRKVKVYFQYIPGSMRRGTSAPEWTLVDVDRSSRNGMWGGSGDLNDSTGGVNAVKIRAARKNVGRRGHRHICRPETEIVPLP
jgi:hypothetical protein